MSDLSDIYADNLTIPLYAIFISTQLQNTKAAGDSPFVDEVVSSISVLVQSFCVNVGTHPIESIDFSPVVISTYESFFTTMTKFLSEADEQTCRSMHELYCNLSLQYFMDKTLGKLVLMMDIVPSALSAEKRKMWDISRHTYELKLNTIH